MISPVLPVRRAMIPIAKLNMSALWGVLKILSGSHPIVLVHFQFSQTPWLLYLQQE